MDQRDTFKNEPKFPGASAGDCGRGPGRESGPPSSVQAAETVHVRGEIVGLDRSTLKVKTREGPNRR